MRKSAQILSAVAVAGLVAAGTSAFTGTGVTNNAGATQFIGGTVSQSITGGTLSSVAYTFGDDSNTAIHTATLTFADANTDGKTPTIAFTASSTQSFTCTAISVSHVSTCTADATGQTGASAITITVTSDPV
jgi:hypothetical protein